MDTLNAIAYNNEKIKEYIEGKLLGLQLKRVAETRNFLPYVEDRDEDVFYIVTNNTSTLIRGFQYNGMKYETPEIDLTDYTRYEDVYGIIDDWMRDESNNIKQYIPDATVKDSGLMTAADKRKLDGLQNYVPPTLTPYALGLYMIETDVNGHVVRAVPYRQPTIQRDKLTWNIDLVAETDPSNPAWDEHYLTKRVVFLEDHAFISCKTFGVGGIEIYDQSGAFVGEANTATEGGFVLYAMEEYEFKFAFKGSQSAAYAEITFEV